MDGRRTRWPRMLAAALLLVGAGAQAEPLTLAVARGPVSLLVYVAEARGYFRQEGLDLQLRDCNSGRDCHRMLSEGRADVATAAELVVALSAPARPDHAIFATLSASSQQIKLVARRRVGGWKPADLHGRRIGTVGGTSAQYYLHRWMVFHGLEPSDVKLVLLPPDGIVEALRRGDIDAAAIWEPQASTALADGAVELPTPRVYTQYFNLVAARATLAARERELAQLLRALLQAQRFVAEAPGRAADVLVDRLNLEPKAALALLREHDYRVRLDQALLSTMSSQQRWAAIEGLIDAAAARRGGAVYEAVEPGPLRKLQPDAVTVVR